LQKSGFSIDARGIVRLPWLEDEMLAHYKHSADGFYRQAAFWSYTGWCQYIVAELVSKGPACGSAPSLGAPPVADKRPQAEVNELRHMLAALQFEHMGSISSARLLENKLSEIEQLRERERSRAAADAEEKLRMLAERENENRRLLADLNELQRQHQLILNSRSWKLTQPLRVLSNRLRRH